MNKDKCISTHLCGSIYDKKSQCKYLLYTESDGETYGKKQLKKYHLYCTAENKCRSIKEVSSFTGNSPVWCPKRLERGI